MPGPMHEVTFQHQFCNNNSKSWVFRKAGKRFLPHYTIFAVKVDLPDNVELCKNPNKRTTVQQSEKRTLLLLFFPKMQMARSKSNLHRAWALTSQLTFFFFANMPNFGSINKLAISSAYWLMLKLKWSVNCVSKYGSIRGLLSVAGRVRREEWKAPRLCAHGSRQYV